MWAVVAGHVDVILSRFFAYSVSMKITSTQSFSDTFIRNLYLFVILSLLLLTGQMWLSNILISLVFQNYLFMVVG